MKEKIAKAIEDSIAESAVLAPMRVKGSHGVIIRGDKNDYTIDITKKKESAKPNIGIVYGSPMVIGIMNRVINGISEYEIITLDGNKVRIAAEGTEYEIKVTRKKNRVI